MGAAELRDAFRRIDEKATRNAITPPADSFLVKLGTSMLPEEPASLIQSPETVARAADERRQSQAVAAREIELETPQPTPPGIQPVTVKEKGMSFDRTPGFQLAGPGAEEPGATSDEDLHDVASFFGKYLSRSIR